MKNIDIINALRNLYPSAVIVRVNKTNCLCIPTEDTQDGIPVYKRVLVGNFAVKATERSTAFDFDTAKQDYETWEKESAERAAKPKKEKDTAASERQATRVGIVQDYINSHSFEHKTSTEIFNDLPGFDGIVPTVGKILKELAGAGLLKMETEKGKNYYSTL